MPSFFGKLFSSRNRVSTKDKENMIMEEDDIFDRRSRLNGSRRSGKSSRIVNDAPFAPSTAGYTTVTAPKMYKGPKSCPGGHQEDFSPPALNRSFGTEYNGERRERRHREHERAAKSRSSKPQSEYGGLRSSNLRRELEDSENDEEYEQEQKLQELTTAYRSMQSKYHRSEERHIYYKRELKHLQKAKAEAERIFMDQIRRLESDRSKYVQKIQQLESMLGVARLPGHLYSMPPPSSIDDTVSQSTHSATSSSMCSPVVQKQYRKRAAQATQVCSLRGYGNLPAPGQFNFSMSSQQNRGMSLHFQDNTPSTSAMGSIGAGEAMTEQSDISLLLDPLHDLSITNSTANFQPLPTSNVPDSLKFDFSPLAPLELDTGMDETRNFRALENTMQFENPRDDELDRSGMSMGRRSQSQFVILRDDGYSTSSTLTTVPSHGIRKEGGRSESANTL